MADQWPPAPGWVEPDDGRWKPPPPPEPKAPRIAVVGVVALVVLAVAVGAVTFIGQTTDDEALEPLPIDRPRNSPSSTEVAATVPPGPIDEVLDDLIAFVEQEPGLSFEQRPQVRVAPDDEFEPALLEKVAVVEDLIAQRETLYRALGLIDADADLLEMSKRSMAEAVLGF
jgi:hypothetical protein